MHIAVRLDAPIPVVQELIRFGSDLEYTNNFGMTPLEEALQLKNAAAIRVLEAAQDRHFPSPRISMARTGSPPFVFTQPPQSRENSVESIASHDSHDSHDGQVNAAAVSRAGVSICIGDIHGQFDKMLRLWY